MNRQELKNRVKELTPEQREQLEQYAESLKEIKKGIKELLSKGQKVDEEGGNHNRSSGLYLQTEE